MYKSHLFASPRPDKNLFHKKLLASGLSMFLILTCLLFVTSPVHGSSKPTHGCAPPNPPPVSGNPIPAPSTVGSVFINEALSQPHSTWNCSEPTGTFSQQADSWIELYNPGSQPLNLYASRAEISLDDGTTWYYLPFGSDIAPGGFLVVFPEENQIDFNPIWMVLLDVENVTIDQAAIPQLQPDQSFARVPDGTQNWQYVGQPTIDASNDSSSQPVTPTPTKTLKPTKTPTGSGSTGSAGAPNSSGTQPAWSGVQLPANATATASTATNPATQLLSQQQSNPATQSSGPDSRYVVLTIVLVLLLLAALVWCRRLFRRALTPAKSHDTLALGSEDISHGYTKNIEER